MTEHDVASAVDQDAAEIADQDAQPASESQALPADGEQADGDAHGDEGADRHGAPGAPAAVGAVGKDGKSTPKRSSALEREGEVAADFLEQLLDIADMDGDIDVDVDGDRAAVAIVDSEEGRVSRRLVGPDGKVLEALQELTRLAVQAATGERSRLMLDVAGHRAQRRAELVTVAQAAIATVKATGDKVPMDAMTAFERKVVHDTVLAAGLRSESDGVEPQRHVVILPA